MTFLVVSLLACVSAAVVPLQHVRDLMRPASAADLEEIDRSGMFERVVAQQPHDDAYGGSTHAVLRTRYTRRVKRVHACRRVDRADHVDRDLSVSVQVTLSRELSGRAAELAVGDLLFGALCDICPVELSVGDGHVCVARVAQVRADGVLDIVPVAEDAAWSMFETIDVSFHHTPGNRSHADALAHLRKRGDDVLADLAERSLQFAAIDWNYDATSKKAAAPIPIEELSTSFGVSSTCVACFAHFATGVEFALRLRTNAYAVPQLESFKLVLFGEFALSSRFETTYPVSSSLEFSATLLDRALTVAPLVIPVGLLAIQIRPSALVGFSLSAAASLPFKLEYGAETSGSIRHGLQLVAGESVRRAQSAESSATAFVKFESPQLDASVTSGLDVQLQLGVGLTIAAAALVQLRPMVNVTLSLRPEATLALTASDTCALNTGYKLETGLKMGARVSTLSLGVGKLTYDVAFGGRLPFAIDVDAVESHVPVGCTLCSGCVPGLAQLRDIVLKSAARVLQLPPLPPPARRTEAFTVTVSTTSIAIGSPLTVRWQRVGGAGVATVTLAVEVRRDAQRDGALDDEWFTNDQLDASVPIEAGELRLAELAPLGLGLVPGVSNVRFIVIASNSDDVFGKSDWVQVGEPSSAAAATPKRIYSGFGPCSVECGSGGTQARTATCVNGLGTAAVADAMCAPAAALTRPCSVLLSACAFVPYKIVAPSVLTIARDAVWSPSLDSVNVLVEFFGGQLGAKTSIFGCKVTESLVPCSSEKPPASTCSLLTKVDVNQKGTTRIRVDVGTFLTRHPLLGVFADVGPAPFYVMLANDAGDDQWAVSPPVVARPPVSYKITWNRFTDPLTTPVSLASPLGTVVLRPPNFETALDLDVGAIAVVGFLVDSGDHGFVIRSTFASGLSGKSYDVSDRRSNKTATFVAATCNGISVGRTCAVCDPGAACTRPSDIFSNYRRLLKTCPQPVEAQVPLPPPSPSQQPQTKPEDNPSFFAPPSSGASVLLATATNLVLLVAII